MDISYLIDAVTVIVSIGGSYLLGRYGRKVNKLEDYIQVSDDGKHAHSFDHMYADGKWRCGVITDVGVCEHVKDFN